MFISLKTTERKSGALARSSLVVLMAVLMVSGCAEAERRKAAEAERQRQAYYHQKCLSYGLSPGTDSYAMCRQRFDAMDRDEANRTRAVILQRMLLNR